METPLYFDSHVHLDAFIEDGSLADVLARAQGAGVDGVIAIGGSPASDQMAVESAHAYGNVWATVGYDRYQEGVDPDVERLLSLLQDPRVVGVGETGLDYHYSAETAAAQCTLFERMLDVACESGAPVVVHSRDAEADLLRYLKAYVQRWSGPSGVPGVIHCYTGGPAFARSLMDLGFMISFSGIVSFKNADEIRDAAKIVPDDLLLVETDAPYLAPVPFRGKRNEPAWVRQVGEAVAAVRGVSSDHVARVTSANTRRLFNLLS